MHRLVFSAALGAAALGCGSWSRVGSGDQPTPAESLTRVLNSTQYYQRLGRLAAAEPLPFVGTVAFAAGTADSVIGVLGLSLENRALAFQREGNVFVARYRVSLSFQREGARSVDLTREEVVRVPTFQVHETRLGIGNAATNRVLVVLDEVLGGEVRYQQGALA